MSRSGCWTRAQGREASGFVYYVSVTGVTGAAHADLGRAGAAAKKTRDVVDMPVVIGFGIDGAEKAKAAASGADGVVIGTAIVVRVENAENVDAATTEVSSFLGEIRGALGPSA